MQSPHLIGLYKPTSADCTQDGLITLAQIADVFRYLALADAGRRNCLLFHGKPQFCDTEKDSIGHIAKSPKDRVIAPSLGNANSQPNRQAIMTVKVGVIAVLFSCARYLQAERNAQRGDRMKWRQYLLRFAHSGAYWQL